MTKEEKIAIACDIITSILGEGWEVKYHKTHLVCNYCNSIIGNVNFDVYLFNYDGSSIFDITVSSLSGINDPTVGGNKPNIYYKAIAALMTNPCVSVAKNLFAEVAAEGAL